MTPRKPDSRAEPWPNRPAGICVYNEAEGYMPELDRITRSIAVMGGKSCVRGMRVTVGMIVGLVASGYAFSEILAAYPYLEDEDVRQALAYAAWRVEELEMPLPAA